MDIRVSVEKQLLSALECLHLVIAERTVATDELYANNQELGALLDGLLSTRADLRAVIAEDGFHRVPKSESRPKPDAKTLDLAQLEALADQLLKKNQAIVEQSIVLRMKSQKLRTAIISLYDGQAKASVNGTDGNHPGYDQLSKRERQVLALIVAGKSSKQIAAELGISFKTAVTHRASIMGKMEVHEIASVVREAIRRGLA
jgi:DNA-binding CsgD family transcriptional regulator